MKNIHTLPTDKPSRLKQNKITKKISLVTKGIDLTSYTPINIYITSDEEIKEGDWFLVIGGIGLLVNTYHKSHGCTPVNDWLKKIILTTDQDLIADGVQSIDDKFLEWFVKNPSCEWVEVKEMKCTGQCWKFIESDYEDTCTSGCELKGDYKIIIPKEEPKLHKCKYCGVETTQSDDECYAKPKQKTLEEAAECKSHHSEEDFIRGAKWQQERMYSLDEIKDAMKNAYGIKYFSEHKFLKNLNNLKNKTI